MKGKMRYLLIAALLLTLACAIGASADSMLFNFDSYAPGTIHGQGGWAVLQHLPFVAQVTAGVSHSGNQSVRISNAVHDGCVDHVTSPMLLSPAGEAGTTAANGRARSSKGSVEDFWFRSASTSYDPGMWVSNSMDNGTGKRMTYVAMYDDPQKGLTVEADDYRQNTNDKWYAYAVATGLIRGAWYHVRVVAQFNDGAGNDVVKVYLGQSENLTESDLKVTCGSWEDYYRFDPEAKADPTPAAVDCSIFRLSNSAGTASTQGVYVDDLGMSTDTRYIVTPKMLTSGDPRFGVDSSIGVGPGATDGAPDGFGSSSFTATVNINGPTAADAYRSLRVIPEAVFGHTVLLSDIASMSYSTKNIDATLDWRYTIYTKPNDLASDPNNLIQAPDDASKWYHSRLESNPNPTTTLGIWQDWSTDAMLFTVNRTGGLIYNNTWSQATSGIADAPLYFFDLILGANIGGGGTGTSQLDAVKIELNDGEAVVLDLEKDAILSLDVDSTTVYVKPGQEVRVGMNVADLAASAYGYQAFMSYDKTKLNLVSATQTTSPFSALPWDGQNLGNGLIDLAGTSLSPVTGSASLAALKFTGASEGVSQVKFRTSAPSTYFTDDQGYEVPASLVDSANIYVDNTPPSITAPGNVSAHTDLGHNYATLADLGVPTTSDNYAVAGFGNNAPAQFGLGQTTVIWTVTDKAGWTATANQIVTVTDNEHPTITAPDDVTVNTNTGVNYATGVALGSATAHDNVAGVKITNDAPGTFTLGATTVTWTATDVAGNTATDTQIVNVVDAEAPVITPAQNYSAYADAGTRTWTPYLETFDTNPNIATSWTVDRFAPAAFDSVVFDGGKRLHIGISSADSAGSRPSGYSSAFYNTQGRQHAFPAGAKVSKISGQLYVGADWFVNKRKSDIWGVGVDATGVVSNYPIIGCSSADPVDPLNAPSVAPRFRYWNDETGVWLDASPATQGWHKLDVVQTDATMDYYVDGVNVGEIANSSTKLQAMILQAYNFGASYDVYWDNVTAGSVLDVPTATDNVGVVSLVGVRSDTKPLADPYPVGTTTITWTATDAAGNHSSSAQTVTVSDKSKMDVTVKLQGSITSSFTRTITFAIGGSATGSGTVAPQTITANVPFVNGVGTVTLDVPASGLWTAITAKDRKHTLRSKVDVNTSGAHYAADFTSKPLMGGDLTDDNYVDILDYGVFAGQYGTSGGANRDADINGDGTVGTGDFTFIQINFLKPSDAVAGSAGTLMSFGTFAASPAPTVPAGLSSITVKELGHRIGTARAKKADINNDRMVDATDVKLFAQQILNHSKKR